MSLRCHMLLVLEDPDSLPKAKLLGKEGENVCIPDFRQVLDQNIELDP